MTRDSPAVPTVTALRPRGPHRVAVELDGAPWRTIPAEVVVRTGLATGVALERPDLRTLRRELRRSEALSRAARLLERRGVSARRLDERLQTAGFAASERADALATLARAGYVDDQRLAVARAEALAERGLGDAGIRADLERAGVPGDEAELAIEALPAEHERAALVVERRGRTPASARFLVRKGFSADTLDALFPELVAPEV